ncbi:MAG: hypothetical protein PHU12_03460 [Candidatus Aenigmarchaeota archaeon]|nr:hypothetical protein [Candidatus Aenigmarchaeota archaeon]
MTTFAEKDKLSLHDYAKLLTDMTHANIVCQNGYARIDKVGRMRDYALKMLAKTSVKGLSGVEIAVAGLGTSMDNSVKPISCHIIPIEFTKCILENIIYARGYLNEDDFRKAPQNNLAAALDSLDFAVMGKIYTNIEGNGTMPANEFQAKFGGVEKNEVVKYYDAFAKEAFKIILPWVEKQRDKEKSISMEAATGKQKQDTIEKLPDWMF